MSYKTIAVHVESAAEKRVKLAVDLARRHDAVLIGVGAGMWAPPVALISPDIGAFSAEIIEAGREQVEADLREAAARFRTLTEGRDVKTEWRAVLDFPHVALADAANAADLLVVGPAEGFTVGGEYRSANPGDVLMAAGRPVLIAPADVERIEARTIVVAWKNTREARRALGDALAAMKQADSVGLLQIRESDDETATVADANAFLTRHGVNVTYEIRERETKSVEEDLIRYAQGTKADLIVAGAYGRSRLREWAFGGVTKGLLAQRTIACQFSH